MPPQAERSEQIGAVPEVLYLIFNAEVMPAGETREDQPPPR